MVPFGRGVLLLFAFLFVASASTYSPRAAASGLGGYVSCAVTDMTLTHNRSALAPVGPVGGYFLTAQGSGQCTKDGVTVVDVTFAFQDLSSVIGTDPIAAVCVGGSGTQAVVVPGTFYLYEASNPSVPVGQTYATVSIAGGYFDPSSHAMSVDFDLPAVTMKSFLQVVEANVPSRLADWQAQYVPKSVLDMISTPDPVPPFDSFYVPASTTIFIPLTGCIESVGLVGGLNTIDTDEVESGLPAGDDRIDDALSTNAPFATTAMQQTPDLAGEGVQLDVDSAASLSSAIDQIATFFGPGIPEIDGTLLEEMAPYAINVKYRTITGGTSTITTVGVPGVRMPVLVPNANNGGIREPIYVTVLVDVRSTGDSSVSLLVERSGLLSSCTQLPIDVSVADPPLGQLQALTGIGMQLGYEALSVGSDSPGRFRVGLSRASGSKGKNSTVIVEIDPACGATSNGTIAVTGRFQNATEGTDLALRVPTSARKLEVITTGNSGMTTLAYRADRGADFHLTGSERGYPLNVEILNLGQKLELCSGAGNACALPWRKGVAMASSASLLSLGGGFSPITLNMLTHNPTYDSSGRVSLDSVTTANLTFSNFAYDVKSTGNPKHVYMNTLWQPLAGSAAVAYSNGKNFGFHGSFQALAREATIKKVHWYQGYYRIRTHGRMDCNSLSVDDSSLPNWQEHLVEHLLCHGGQWGW